MKPRSAKKTFLKLISNANRQLNTLAPSEGVELMLAFYRDHRAAGCRIDADGDMLLFQWGTYDWGEGEAFEVEITRQFILGDGDDEDIFQLSLTFRFQPTMALRQLADGNRWCHAPEEIEAFRAFIHSSSPYAAITPEAPSEVRLEYGGAG